MGYIAPTTQGWISQSFGTNPGGYNPAGGHTGEDIALPVGTPLVAMADGVVVHVGYFSGKYSDNPWWIEPSFAGFVVTVDYGPYLSHYAHCSGSPVLSGRRVAQGEVVAYSGNTGTATSGPHCHWELMPDGWDFNNGTYGRINPRTALGSLSPQGGTITPLSEEDDDMASAEVNKKLDDIWAAADTARKEATNAKLAAQDALKVATDARNEATNAKLAARDAVTLSAQSARAAGGDGPTIDAILDALAKRLQS